MSGGDEKIIALETEQISYPCGICWCMLTFQYLQVPSFLSTYIFSFMLWLSDIYSDEHPIAGGNTNYT